MAQRLIGVEDAAPGAGVVEYRARDGDQYLIFEDEKVPSFRGMVGDRWAGNGTAGTVKCVLSNLAGSGVLVAVRSVVVSMAPFITVATGALDFWLTWQASTAAAGAGTISKENVGTGADAAETSSASVEFRTRHATDSGGGATAITLTPGNRVSNVLRTRAHTLVSQMRGSLGIQDPRLAHPFELVQGDRPQILRAGESLALLSTGSATNFTAFTSSWLWEEYTLP